MSKLRDSDMHKRAISFNRRFPALLCLMCSSPQGKVDVPETPFIGHAPSASRSSAVSG